MAAPVLESFGRAGKALAKYKYLMIVVLAGLAIMMWPRGTGPPPENAAAGQAEFDLAFMERRLEQALSSIAGAGKVEVMLTLKTDMEVVVVSDVNTRNRREYENGAPRIIDEEEQLKTVIIGASQNGIPIVQKRIYPQYLGALVVCDGAGDARVRMALLEAVARLTGLRGDAISVVQYKGS